MQCTLSGEIRGHCVFVLCTLIIEGGDDSVQEWSVR
jgi:hypothetical protein